MATLSPEALKRIQDQAAKQGISMDKINQVAQQKNIAMTPVSSVSPIQTPNINLWTYNKFGANIKPIEAATPGTINKRNDLIISWLGASATDPTAVANYLKSQTGFQQATAGEQQNTINNIIQRATATVATPGNPLLIKQPGATNLEYDPNNPQDFIYKMNARKAAGGKVTEQDMYNYQIAYDAQKKSAGEPTDPYQAWIQQQQDALKAQQDAQMSEREKAKQIKQQELDAKYGNLRASAEEAGKRQAEAGQKATSFSGFGRSTFNADQQAQIGQQTGNALAQLENAKQLELQAWEAEQNGADVEALAPLYKSIQSAKNASAKFQIDAITAANDANAKTGASFTQALQNLAAVASESGLNMDEKWFEQAAKAMQGMTPQEKEAYLQNFDQQEQLLLRGLSNTAVSWDFEFIEWTKTQGSGYFNKNTGEFVPLSSSRWQSMSKGSGSWTGSSKWALWETWNIAVRKLQNIASRINSSLARSSAILDPDVAADINWLKYNLTLDKIWALKKSGVSLWALSEWEWTALWNAVGASLNAGMSKEKSIEFINDMLGKFGAAPVSVWKTTTTTTPPPVTYKQTATWPNGQKMWSNDWKNRVPIK